MREEQSAAVLARTLTLHVEPSPNGVAATTPAEAST
jgi:hypothetical protein